MSECKRCRGIGKISLSFDNAAECPDCNGTGEDKK